MWWFYALLSAVFAGLTAVLAKKGIDNVDSDLATAIRTTVILFITWGIALFKGVANPAHLQQISRSGVWFLVLSGVATGLSWVFYFKALSLGKVSQVAPVDKMSIVFALLFSYIILGEQMDLKTLLGAGLIVAGTLVMVL